MAEVMGEITEAVLVVVTRDQIILAQEGIPAITVATVVMAITTQDMAAITIIIMAIILVIIRAILVTASQVITMTMGVGWVMEEVIHGITGNIRSLFVLFMVGIGRPFVWSLAPRKILTAISFQSLKMDTLVQFTKTESKRSKMQPWIVATMKAPIKRAAVSWIASQVTKSKMRKALSESLALFAFFIERREFSG
jgi:hypothetical protein